jgi:methylglyoxal synthase
MEHETPALGHQKKLALVAHDNKQHDLLAWAWFNCATLAQHTIYAPDIIGIALERQLGIEIQRLKSGWLNGDQHIDDTIAVSEIDLILFFWNPLEPLPHDPDVTALLRIAQRCNIPILRLTHDFSGPDASRRLATPTEFRGTRSSRYPEWTEGAPTGIFNATRSHRCADAQERDGEEQRQWQG